MTTSLQIKNKFVRKWMRMAKFVATDQNPCYSREVGVVITDPVGMRVLGTGYNGPAPGQPHTDTKDYLENFFWPQLTQEEKEKIRQLIVNRREYFKAKGGWDDATLDKFFKQLRENIDTVKNTFCVMYDSCKTCPRRLVDAGPGVRSELCSCGHAERHAITNAACDLTDAIMFVWCGQTCIQCTDAILHAGIKNVFCLKTDLRYHPVTEWMYERSDCTQHFVDEEWIMSNDT